MSDRSFHHIITHDEADWHILSLANDDHGKFAIEVGMPTNQDDIDAFERGIVDDWFNLVDVGIASYAPGRFMRIFKLTERGWKRRDELYKVFG